MDHDSTCDVDVYGALCLSVRYRGLGVICQIARSNSVEEYASDSDYNPCDEFEGLELVDSSSVTDLSRSVVNGCLCDRRVVGTLCSHICLGPFRLKHNGHIDDIAAEIHVSEDEFDDEDCHTS